MNREEVEESRKEAVKKAVQALTDAVNGLDEKEVAQVMFEALQPEHRTLQQSFWKAIISLAYTYGLKATHDLRNEDAVKFCQGLTKAIKDGVLPGYLRLI